MNSPNSSAQQTEPTYVDRICKRHGAFRARVFPVLFEGVPPAMSNCPQCLEESAAEKAAQEAAAAEREKQRRVKGLVEASMIPPRYLNSTIDGYKGDGIGQKRVRTACTRFVESWRENRSNGPSVIMCGRPGTGKTHLACAIGLDLIECYGSSVVFRTALSAIRSIKDTYSHNSEISDSDAIDRMIKPDLLILDEIGVQVGSEHERMLIFEIINERYQQCRSTILISNLNRGELGEYLGERIMDRFRECGGILAFDWESYRGAKK